MLLLHISYAFYCVYFLCHVILPLINHYNYFCCCLNGIFLFLQSLSLRSLRNINISTITFFSVIINAKFCSSYGRPFNEADSSLNLEETTVASQRLTPAKYATAHIKVSINSGIVVKVPPHYPLDGQSASVEVGSLQTVLNSNEEYNELVNFPGPLIRGVTHKKTIIEYCESKIRQANSQNFRDCQSYVLMWELLILLIRQNGVSALCCLSRFEDLRLFSIVLDGCRN